MNFQLSTVISTPGAGALAGIRLNNGVFANIGYQLSLTDISEGDGRYKNRGLQLSVGYFF